MKENLLETQQKYFYLKVRFSTFHRFFKICPKSIFFAQAWKFDQLWQKTNKNFDAKLFILLKVWKVWKTKCIGWGFFGTLFKEWLLKLNIHWRFWFFDTPMCIFSEKFGHHACPFKFFSIKLPFYCGRGLVQTFSLNSFSECPKCTKKINCGFSSKKIGIKWCEKSDFGNSQEAQNYF